MYAQPPALPAPDSPVGAVLAERRAGLLADLAGDPSTAQAALVEVTVRSWVILDAVDAYLLSLPSVGDFCFDLAFTPKSVVVSVDLDSQDTGFVTTRLGASAGNCPASAEASVHVSVATTPPHGENDDFFVAFN